MHESLTAQDRETRDSVHVLLPLTTPRDAQFERPSLMVAEGSFLPLPVRQFFHPYVLAFLALALAVGGWSYGYKLSRYLHHHGVTKASATRMWVEHRDDSKLGVAHQSPTHRIPAALLAVQCSPPLPRFSRNSAVNLPASRRVPFMVAALIPFRAPPALLSPLA
jgi:hypothetical protein